MNSKTYKAEIRPADWKLGDGNIKLGAVMPGGDWSGHMWFNELQLVLDGQDTDDCVPFSVQESIDMQMDLLISNGTIPQAGVALLDGMGFMDIGTDGQKHFHSSPRFLGIQTGNGQNGNSTQEVYEALKTYGILPYTDLPPNVQTAAEYYAPCTADQLSKAKTFLSLLGGSKAIQYQSVSQGSPKNFAAINAALELSPLQAGVAVAANWNQVTPGPDPDVAALPQHCVSIYKANGETLPFEDHYPPYLKEFDPGYPINFISQVIIVPVLQEEQKIVQTTQTVVSEIATAPIPNPAKETMYTEIQAAVEKFLATL